ncbi:ABC transporter permease subunit [Georgenia alba]|uniref:ABC transporter permease subunit n=1 Tax=Georgenia alba TaxID=2233858 RepID=A0ABW2Q614_9MICO
MTAATTERRARRESASRRTAARLRFSGVMRGEWIKLFSLRSTWWTLGITVLVMVLFALVQASSLDFMMDNPQMSAVAENLHGAEIVTAGYAFGAVAIGVLGSLLVTGEYSTGMIRSTLAAVPTRLPVLVAKAIALVVVSAVTAALSIAGTQLATTSMLAEYDLVPPLDQETTWQIYGGMAFFFVAVALLGLGAGAILRHSAGTITAVLSALLLLPIVLTFINAEWVQDVSDYVPLNAAGAFLSVSGAIDGEAALTPWEGVAVVGAYPLVALVAGAVLLRRRDA